MVMGGGPSTSQVQSIEKELAARGVNPQGALPKLQNNIKVDVKIDGQGRAQTVVNDMGTNVDARSNRGDFFQAIGKPGMMQGH